MNQKDPRNCKTSVVTSSPFNVFVGLRKDNLSSPPLSGFCSIPDFFDRQSMASRWAWMLLASYAALAALSVIGIALAYFDFGHDPLEPLPDPPKNKTIVIHREYYDDRTERTEEYKDYVDQTEAYANYYYDPRTFVVVPSFVAAIIAIVMLLAGICSRQIFSTTVSLYASLGTLVLTIVYITIYQIQFSWLPDGAPQIYYLNSYISATLFLAAMIVFVALQMILAGKELRTQKTGWPTFNFTNIFTMNTVLVVANVTVGVYTLIFLNEYSSAVLHGLRHFGDDWDDPRTKLPIYYALPSLTAGVFGLVVNTEALLSHIFGHSHYKLMGIFGLFSTFGYGAMAVFLSPGFVRAAIGPYRNQPDTMIFAIIMSVLNFIYTFGCFLCPRLLVTSPAFVKVLVKTVTGLYSEATSASDVINKDALTPAMDKVQKNAEQLMKRFQGVKYPLYSIVVLVLSFIAIILNATVMNSPWGSSWSVHMMIAANVAIINRVLPKVMLEVSSGVTTKEPGLQVLLNFVIEAVLLIFSVIGTFCDGWDLSIGAAVLNIPVIIYEFMSIRGNPSLKAGIAALAAPKPSDGDDTQPLKENEEPSATQDEEYGKAADPLV